MLKMKKEVIAVLFAAVMTVLFIGLLPWNSAHALTLLNDKMVLDKYGTDDTTTYSTDNSALKSAVSSKPSVANAVVEGSKLDIIPRKSGHAVITVTGEDDTTATLDLTITENYIGKWLKEEIYVARAIYGTSWLRVDGIPGAKGTVIVGKTKYTVKALPASGRRKIKLKNYTRIKLGTKITLKLKFDGQSALYRTKIKSSTYLKQIRGKSKIIKTQIEDLHKGDKVTLRFKGRTYTKKIRKNLLGKETWLRFRVKRKVSPSATMKIKVINKDKKTLEYRVCQLTYGVYPYDEGEDDDETMDE